VVVKIKEQMQSEEKSIRALILQSIDDFATIIQKEIQLAKEGLIDSFKKFTAGSALFIVAFLLINVSLLFLLVAAAFGLSALGLPTWAAFLLVAVFMVVLAFILFAFGVRSFKKMKGTREASQLARETREYIRDNIKRPDPEDLPPIAEKFKDLS
jgi:Flp pilus assembly protein TadB